MSEQRVCLKTRILKIFVIFFLIVGYFYASAFSMTHLIGVGNLINWSMFPVIPVLFSAVILMSGFVDGTTP